MKRWQSAGFDRYLDQHFNSEATTECSAEHDSFNKISDELARKRYQQVEAAEEEIQGSFIKESMISWLHPNHPHCCSLLIPSHLYPGVFIPSLIASYEGLTHT